MLFGLDRVIKPDQTKLGSTKPNSDAFSTKSTVQNLPSYYYNCNISKSVREMIL